MVLQTATILQSRGPIFNEFRDLLARRLREPELARALCIVDASMNELGGGPRRVEQRLRSTLKWCRDPSYPRLMLDSSPQEIALSWLYRDPSHSPCKSAAEHHREHARRLQFIGHELRLNRDHRKGLVRAAAETAASAARLARNNTANRGKQPGQHYDYARNDQIKRSIRLSKITGQYSDQLVRLNRQGWIVCFLTIVLPTHARPTLSRSKYWGLAGSPDAAQGAETLLSIFRSAKPKKNVSSQLGGVWRLQEHDSDQVHLHGVIAFKDRQVIAQFLAKLETEFEAKTYQLRNLKVIAGFGVGFEVEDNSIDFHTLPTEADIRRTVVYVMRELDGPVNLLPGTKRYAAFGALLAGSEKKARQRTPSASKPIQSISRGTRQPIETASSEDVRIKHFPDPQPQEKLACILHFPLSKPAFWVSSISFCTAAVAHRHIRPPVRAPPAYCNPFQDRSIAVRYSYFIHLF